MKIRIGRYTYEAPEGTQPGDKVRIPCTWVDEAQGRYGDKWATVTAVGPDCSDYNGSLTRVLEVKKGE